MIYALLADFVVVCHLSFVLFAVLGGLLVLRWPKLLWLHIPTAVWAALIEFSGWICPLTSLENRLRMKSGETGYTGGFIEHYILPLLYPDSLTRETQIVLGIGVVVMNLVIYSSLFFYWKKR